MFKPQLKSPLRNTIMRALLAGNSTPSVPSFYFNFSNPSNVTLGAAQARGNITSTQNAHITMSASLSRVVGVAPLYVNIDMTGTTSDLTANATHDLFYSVNWGDSGAGQWANGVQSPGLTDKNWSFGPVGGHVFETPGTYLVTPTSTDGVNSAAKPGYVTVLDPNVVYDPAYGAGYETICISNSNNFTGAPSGATQVNTAGNTDMYAAWVAHKASNKRILFCKADSWTVSAEVAMTGLSNVTLGGYGTGAARAFGIGTLVNVDATAVNGNVFTTYTGCSDIRLCEMKVLGTGKVGSGVYLINGISQFTSYKMEFRGCSGGFNAYPGGGGTNNVFDQHCIYECVVDDVYGYPGVDTPRANVTTTSGLANITATAHFYKVGYAVHFPTAPEGTTQFPSTGTFPTPLSVSTTYYISADSLTANTFRLAATLADARAGINSLVLTASGTYPLFANGISGGIGAFVGLVRGGILGCYFDSQNHGEQTLRIPYIDRSHINNNYIARPNQGKNVFKIHSFIYKEVPLYSEKFVVSANVMSLRGGYSYGEIIAENGVMCTQVGNPSIIIANGGASGYEKTRNAIVENNILLDSLGYPKDGRVLCAVGGPNMTIRNNIADFSVKDRTSSYSGNDPYASIQIATVTTSTEDGTTGVRVYNNTMYSNLYNSELANAVGVLQPTRVTATGAVGTPGVFTALGSHFMIAGSVCRLAGTPPAPLSVGVDYFVTATNLTATTFTIAETNGGAALSISTAGTCQVYRGPEVDDLIVKNNIWYFPHQNPATPAISLAAVWLAGSPPAAPTRLVVSNNTDTVAGGAIRTSPNFVATPPTLLTDWRPTSGYAVDSGTTVPVIKDFNMASRVGGTYDLGAVLP